MSAINLNQNDAGEFLYQNLIRVEDNAARERAAIVVCLPDPTPEQLAQALGSDERNYSALLSGLNEYGLTFEFDEYMDDATRNLAENGIRTAEAFVNAARKAATS